MKDLFKSEDFYSINYFKANFYEDLANVANEKLKTHVVEYSALLEAQAEITQLRASLLEAISALEKYKTIAVCLFGGDNFVAAETLTKLYDRHKDLKDE